MAADSIDRWLTDLAELPEDERTFNPYRRKHLRDNMGLYLRYLSVHSCGVLVVGEAAGYMGCRHSGIPFTSAPQIRGEVHTIFREVGPQMVLHEEVSERSAQIVWGLIAEFERLPVLWNAFPCHPHKPGEPQSNRGPTQAEVAAGAAFLTRLVALLRPHTIIGLGRHAERLAGACFPEREITYVRHPSMGGKPAFISGLSPILTAAQATGPN